MRPKLKKTVYLLLLKCLVIIAAAAFLGACGKEPPPREPVVHPVKMATFGEAKTETFSLYPGKIDADRTANLAYEKPGRLTDLPVKRGQRVKKGEILAQIDPLDFKSDVAAKKAAFAEAKADLDRYRQLYEEDAVPLADLDIRQRKFDVAKAELAIAEKYLRDTALRAPFDGIIARKFVDNFQDVKAKEPIVRLQDISKLEVLINIPESDFVRKPDGKALKRGPADLKAFAEFDSLPGREFPLTLKEFESEADPKTQSFMVKFLMTNPDDANIAPGMTATVKVAAGDLKASESSPATVPVSAIFSDESGKNYVWVIDPSSETVSRREVTVGDLTGDSIVIRGGLKSGDTIATTGVHRLQEGSKVRPYKRLMGGPSQ